MIPPRVYRGSHRRIGVRQNKRSGGVEWLGIVGFPTIARLLAGVVCCGSIYTL